MIGTRTQALFRQHVARFNSTACLPNSNSVKFFCRCILVRHCLGGHRNLAELIQRLLSLRHVLGHIEHSHRTLRTNHDQFYVLVTSEISCDDGLESVDTRVCTFELYVAVLVDSGSFLYRQWETIPAFRLTLCITPTIVLLCGQDHGPPVFAYRRVLVEGNISVDISHSKR
jgi:hypothetical protein